MNRPPEGTLDGTVVPENRNTDLLDLVEPDEELLFAAEREADTEPARRRALVVLVRDHVPDGDDVDRVTTELLIEAGFQVDACVAVKNKKNQIRKAIETAVVGGVDLLLTVGGTGVRPRDKSPEATKTVLDQELTGITQALRASARDAGLVDAMLSRGVAGLSGSTVVVNLAGSREAVEDGLSTLPPLVMHLIDQLNTHSVDEY